MLEQLFPSEWIERKPWSGFIIGFSYAVFGIASALLLFRDDFGLAAVAFTSLLALPTVNRLLSIESKQIASEKKLTIWKPFRDHEDIFLVYIFMFLGIMLAFSFFSIMLPGVSSSALFSE